MPYWIVNMTLYDWDISNDASLPALINNPAIACTNRKKAIEIPKRRWMVRTFTEFILFSLATQSLDPLTIQKHIRA